MAQFRETPYSVFNYLVDLSDGTEGDVAGGFSEISGLNAEVTLAEYRRGNSLTNYVTKVPAINKAGDVTLKRGVVGANNIHTWLNEVRAGAISKKTVTIKLKSENPTSSTAVVTWKLINALPIKWTGPTLTAKGGSDVAIEELVLAVEYIEQV